MNRGMLASVPVQPFQSMTLQSGMTLTSENISTSLVESGKHVELELLVSRPFGPGPFPTLIFNHGSTGRGDDPNLFRRRWANIDAATYFVKRGWMIVFPQRRGRGGSSGTYAEGLKPDGSGYDCTAAGALPGVDRAIEGLDEVMIHLCDRQDVMRSRLLVAGQSRGGVLSIAYAGERPDMFVGAVNFAGGWLSDYWPESVLVNSTIFRRGAKFGKPTLWLYGENDPYYSLAHSRSNFDAFESEGGTGRFESYPVPGENEGHSLISNPRLWCVPVTSNL